MRDTARCPPKAGAYQRRTRPEGEARCLTVRRRRRPGRGAEPVLYRCPDPDSEPRRGRGSRLEPDVGWLDWTAGWGGRAAGGSATLPDLELGAAVGAGRWSGGAAGADGG